MNYKITAISFKLTKFILIKLLFTFFVINSINLYASEKETPPRVCFGIGGSFAYYNVDHKYGKYPEWEPGFGYGGGIIFESMLTDMFGIHSGIWYSKFKINFKAPEDKDGTDDVIIEQKIKSDIITIPFYLITSFGPKFLSVNILTGFNFAYILSSHMESGQNDGSEDIKKYLGNGQAGIGGGIEFILRPTRFTGIFVSGIAEYYFTDLIAEVTETSDFLYNFQIRSGFILCTF